MSDLGVTRTRALVATALVLLLTACGQRGPLYLPKKTRTEITPAAPTAPADADSKPQDDGAPASPASPPSAP
jgi:predicted small lipoprotein YifL